MRKKEVIEMTSNRTYSVSVVMLILLGLSALASCGGAAPTQDAGFLLYAVDNSGPIVTDQPPTPRQLSDWNDPAIEESALPDDIFPEIDMLEALSQSVVSGENELDLGGQVAHSSEVSVEATAEGDVLKLRSLPGEMGYAMFGVKSIPAGERVLSVQASGEGFFGGHDGSGLYIGLSDMESGAYAWYGPFAAEDEWVAASLALDTVNENDRSYFVLAVHNGDAADIEHLLVRIGEPFEFPEVEVVPDPHELMPPFPPDPFEEHLGL